MTKTYDESLTDAEMDDLLADPIESLDEAAEDIEAYIVGLRAQLAHERQRVARCEKALRFYADEQTYEDHGHWFGHGPDQVWMPMVPAEQDRGARARAALTATEEAMDDE